MAIGDLKEGRQWIYAYNEADSGTFKTPAADSDTFTRINCEHFNIERGLVGHDIPGSHGTRQVVEANTFTTAKGAMAKFTVQGPLSLNEVDQYLYAHTQKVVEASTPFLKTFTPFVTHPDFSASAGHFLTWASGSPTAAQSQKAISAVCSRFKMIQERNKFAMIETDWVSPEPATVDSTVAEDGTFEFGLKGPGGADDSTNDYGFLHWNSLDIITMDFDGVASPIADALVFEQIEFELQYEDVEGCHPDGTGGYDSLAMKGLTGTFQITIKRDSYSQNAFANVAGNNAVTIILGWGAAGALIDGEMEVTLHGKVNPDGIAEDKEGIASMVISGTLAATNDAATPMYSIKLSNGIDRSWPAA